MTFWSIFFPCFAALVLVKTLAYLGSLAVAATLRSVEGDKAWRLEHGGPSEHDNPCKE